MDFVSRQKIHVVHQFDFSFNRNFSIIYLFVYLITISGKRKKKFVWKMCTRNLSAFKKRKLYIYKKSNNNNTVFCRIFIIFSMSIAIGHLSLLFIYSFQWTYYYIENYNIFSEDKNNINKNIIDFIANCEFTT